MYFLSITRSLLLSTVFTVVLFTAVMAQKNKSVPVAPDCKFGTISREQFTAKMADSTAEAVVLYDYGEVSFEENNGTIWISQSYHVRTRIHKKSAYDRAIIQIPIHRSSVANSELVADFDGYSYNITDGNITIDRVAKSNHFTEKVSDNYSIEKYSLPNVREGTIIEYRYVLRTPFSVNYNPRTWYFQQSVPVNWSEYRIVIPDYFYYKVLQSGYLMMAINERKNTTVDLYPGQNGASASSYRFVMKDIPAFRDEPFITTDEDYLAKIEFELASYQWVDLRKHDISVDWPSLDRTLLTDADFGGQIRRTGFLREMAKTLLSQSNDTLSRVTAAYEFIRKTVKWNEKAGLYPSEDIKKVFDNKKGNAAGINLMLVALLREMDLDANPVILSTRSHGRVNESYALIRKFNYVVAHITVGGKDMLLDATDPLLAPGMLPIHCLNGTGRLVHQSKSKFISLVSPERDAVARIGSFIISDDGDISGTLKQSYGGYGAWMARKQFVSEGKVKYLADIQKKRPVWQIEKATFSGETWQTSAFNSDLTLTIPEACGRAGDKLYLHPMLTEGQGANPFKEAERLYPVDLGFGKEETFIATYTLPTGYEVEEMPKGVSMTLPNNEGRFIYQVAVTPTNQLQVNSRILLRKAVYTADDYQSIRELFARIVAKHAEPVVLKLSSVAEKK